jgi:hypothetical protein
MSAVAAVSQESGLCLPADGTAAFRSALLGVPFQGACRKVESNQTMKPTNHTLSTSGHTSLLLAAGIAVVVLQTGVVMAAVPPASPRERLSINDDWRFTKGDPAGLADNLAYPRGRGAVPTSGIAAGTAFRRVASDLQGGRRRAAARVSRWYSSRKRCCARGRATGSL